MPDRDRDRRLVALCRSAGGERRGSVSQCVPGSMGRWHQDIMTPLDNATLTDIPHQCPHPQSPASRPSEPPVCQGPPLNGPGQKALRVHPRETVPLPSTSYAHGTSMVQACAGDGERCRTFPQETPNSGLRATPDPQTSLSTGLREWPVCPPTPASLVQD